MVDWYDQKIKGAGWKDGVHGAGFRLTRIEPVPYRGASQNQEQPAAMRTRKTIHMTIDISGPMS